MSQCQLCDKKIKPGQFHFSTFKQDERLNTVERGGIHVKCLRDVVDSMRTLGLTISQLSH